METLTEKPRKQPGPRAKGYAEQIHVLVTSELKEWCDNHPEGISHLVRRLIREEYERQQRRTSSPQG